MRNYHNRNRKPSAIPYTGYIEPVGAGETITWGSWSNTSEGARTLPITLFPYASGGDYSGNTVERSNYRVLVDDEHVMRRSVLITGGYGTFGIAYIGHPTRPIRETVASLESYPLLDESDHSELEQELQNTQWQEWGRADFKRELVKAFDHSENMVPIPVSPRRQRCSRAGRRSSCST